MELRHLRYFVAVAEELNYRKASERLRVAQPALSSQIKDLEHELGVKLLDRDTGGVRLNDAGGAFLEEARLILAHAQRAVVVAREAAQGRRGRLTVGHFAPLLMGFMPATLKVFHDRFPEVDVSLMEIPLADQIAGLESGQIQIGFMINGNAPVPAGLQRAEVARSPIRAVVGRDHRLARVPRISLAEMGKEPLLALQFTKGVPSVHAEIMRRVFINHSGKDPVIRSVIGAEAFRATLESGLGVSFIAEIGGLARSQDLIFIPLTDTGPDLFVELYALWRDGEPSVLVENFIAVLRKVVPQQTIAPGKKQRTARAR